jgi:hypothetical protein
MSELFDIPESKSPRLQWIEENGILTGYNSNTATWYAALPKDGDEQKDIRQLVTDYHHTLAASRIAKGQTEDDAITNLAKAIGLRLWNERGIA